MARLRLAEDLPSPRPAIMSMALLVLGILISPLLLNLGLGFGWDYPAVVGATLALALIPGMALWPILFRTLTLLPDRGLAVSFVLGPVLWTFLVFICVRVGFPLSATVIATTLITMLLFGGISAWSQWQSLLHFLRLHYRRVATVLICGLVAFSAMTILRVQTPYISYHSSPLAVSSINDVAAEKFTDFTIFHNLLVTPILPPEDTWVAGLKLNYYYFGHLVHAIPARFLGTDPGVAYNLALANAALWLAIAAAGLGMTVGRGRLWAAILAVFLILAAGNLDSLLQALTLALGQPANTFLRELPTTSPWWLSYDFWRPSRAVEHTITEFPAFSLLLGDLHAHLLSLPILISGLILALHFGRCIQSNSSLLETQLKQGDQMFWLALTFGALSATNSWDAITLATVLGALVWVSDKRPSLLSALEAILFSLLVLLLGAKILFYPFSSGFTNPFPPFGLGFSPLSGLPVVVSSPFQWVAPGRRSGVDEYLAMWGWLVLPLVLGWFVSSVGKRRSNTSIVVLAFLAATGLVFPLYGSFIATWLTAGIIVAAWWTVCVPPGSPYRRHRLALASAAAILLLLTETIYLDDIFGSPIDRINTVFKVWYGLWPVMVALAIGQIARLQFAGRNFSVSMRGLILLAWLLPMMVYPVFGTMGRLQLSTPTAGAENMHTALDGLAYLKRERPGDYAIAQYIQQNLRPGEVVVEVAGSSYNFAGRIATLSGKPVFAGWLNHAYGWRGERFIPERDRRTTVTSTIYTTTQPLQLISLLTDNRVRYVVLGEPERRAYLDLNEPLLSVVAPPVLSMADSLLLEFPGPTQASLAVASHPPEKLIPPTPSISETVTSIPVFQIQENQDSTTQTDGSFGEQLSLLEVQDFVSENTSQTTPVGF